MNKYTLLALIWFAVGIYSLIFRETTHDLPPFPHFDKVAHFGLFFIQIWLSARAFMQSKKAVPYLGLMLFALLYAFGSEWGQAQFTENREASWLDGAADLAGAGFALLLVRLLKK
ncbi:TPA: VanZ family protein [Mannheimia haemolytica]